ncbi:MAG: biotin--[acetyl-CoA-carboxylase] ligase [Planctomycetes bacterium]|nr:biotin--[acetyl-CoA-carboxylase] ligase [Planctomycetota bacterium]
MIRAPLRESRIEALLGDDHAFARDVRCLGIVDSTNDLVAARGKQGANDGLVIVADGQRKGRGRRGTTWHTPARRAIALSALSTPLPEDRRLLSPAVGLAVADALATLDLDPQLKWPNDVLVADAKVCGILVELIDDPVHDAFAVIGIGLNANVSRDDLPTDAALPATSLHRLTGSVVDREAVVAATLDALGRWIDRARDGDRAAIIDAWSRRDWLTGRAVAVRVGDRVVEGRVVAVDPVEALTLRTADGTAEVLRAEHAHVVRVL